MRMFRSSGQQSEKTNSVNMAVKVEAYVEDKGVLFVEGTRLETKEKVMVALTNRGELASNSRRPPLSDFRDKKNNLGVEVGGVIGFDRCYPNGVEGRFYAGWPTFMAGSGNKEDIDRVKVNRNASLQIRSSTDGRLYGSLLVWQSENIMEFANSANLEAASAKWMNDVLSRIPNAHGAAIMRARNAAGEVVAYTFLYGRYDKEAKGYEKGEKTLENFKASRSYEGFTSEAQAGGAVKFDIVPAVSLDLSPKALQEGGNALRATEKSYQRDGELISKGTTFVMDPNHIFVMKVMAHDPFGDTGIDPALMGKGGAHVSYNAAFKAALNGEPAAESPAAEAAAQPAQVDAGPSIMV